MYKRNRYITYIWVALACWMIALSSSTYAASINSVVAVVNDDVITQGELDAQIAINRKAMMQPGAPQLSESQLHSQTLDQLIDEKIVTQMAKRYGIKVTDADVQNTINHIAQSNHLSVAQLKQILEGQGVSWSQYQQQIQQQMINQKIYSEVISPDVNVNDAEVNKVLDSNAFEQASISAYHVGDILIPLPDNATPQEIASAKATAMQAAQALKQGKPFADVAAQYSSAGSNADLGWRPPSELPTVFASAVTEMKVGDVHDPIQTGNGWHVIKLIDIQGTVTPNSQALTQTHARHILIKSAVAADDGPVKAELESIRNQVLHGGDFAKLAEKYSQDSGSAVKGGDLGWVTPGEMVPPFEQAMDQTAVGQISEPVKTQYGWHIIQVLARRQDNDPKTYKQMMARNYVFQQKFSQARQDWLKRMREASYIKIVTPNDSHS